MLKELIIKVNNQDIHLSPELHVPIQQTNIPFEHCKFRSNADIFWRVELLEYNPDNKCWKIKVLDYFAEDIKNFTRQKSEREVQRIAFEKFDWQELKKHLSYYQKIKLLDILENHDSENIFTNESNTIHPFSIPNVSNQNIEQAHSDQISITLLETKPIIKMHEVEFSVYFSETDFRLGYVTFSKIVKEIGDKIDFKIQNNYILAEFENIKSWFAKKLKAKKFKVFATITTTDGKVTEVIANSPQISMIGVELIDSIKYQRTIALTKSPRVLNPDKSLFTADELFGEMETNEAKGNVFSQNEQDILGILLDNRKTKNRKQLEYLSGNKQAEFSKLKFTIHPYFGFLFFIEGTDNNHFVWELLNSHATYIWSINKSETEIELQYKRIEASINTIRDCGREQYKRAYRQNHHDNDLVFCTIEHDSSTSDFVDGFVKWKHNLNEKIT
jgi:hypothetical protein